MFQRVLFFFFILQCSYSFAQNTFSAGDWTVEFQINDSVKIYIAAQSSGKDFIFKNAEEKIEVEKIYPDGDSIILQMPVFDSELKLKSSGDGFIGFFINHARLTLNRIPVLFYKTKPVYTTAFEVKKFEGIYECTFTSDNPPLNKAVGIFNQKGDSISGTFLTPTGDYRFLAGKLDAEQFTLSCFDGSHLFLFNGIINDDGMLNGNFYSGKHHHEKWSAFKNEKASLPAADSLNYIKPGYTSLSFSFKDCSGKTISFPSKEYNGKVVIVQVMGSWCPNCMDETAFLSPLYKKYHSKGLEVIGLDYEKINDPLKACSNIERLKNKYGIAYDVLFAGSSNKAEASKTLPALNAIVAFPTTVFIDKTGVVRKVHTGYSGPATGIHYDKQSAEIISFIEKLLSE